MCCTGPAWKREVVQDHKFDFIDTRDYHTKNFGVRVQYLWIYILVLKSFLVYLSDIYTAVTMLSSDTWTSSIYTKCTSSSCPTIQFNVAKWIFVGCIIFSFLLLAYESQKAKKIIASRDISYAFTNVMANNYYSLRSYNHFCFFAQIENSTKKKDDFAFFIFFTFKEWKRVLLADGPRQTINGLILYSFWYANGKGNPLDKLSEYYNGDYVTAMLLVTMVFTVLIFIGSLLLLIVAGVLYIPLLCYIRGNLKEYCCHKVDKRIAELIKKKTQQRVQQQAALAKKEAAGDFSHLKGKKGAVPASLPKQPTLPSVSIDDDPAQPQPQRFSQPLDQQYWGYQGDGKSDYASTYNGTTGGPGDFHDYPPMPGYYGAAGNGQGAESLYSYDDAYGRGPAYGGDAYESSAALTHAAAPIAGAGHGYPYAPQPQHPHQQYYPDDGYGGGAGGGAYGGGHEAAPSYSPQDTKRGGNGSYAM